MERQLKERLIGAAVLVAAAVVMVPEMFSGPSSPVSQEPDSAEAATQLKTYRIELQSSRAAMPVPEAAVAAPAERPQDEVATPAEPADTDNVSASSAASTIAQQLPQPASSHALSKEASTQPKASEFETAKPIVAKPDSPKDVPIDAKPASGNWVVQVGSFAAQDKAQQIASKLKQQGYPAFIGSVKVNGRTLYRVRVGAMADRATADATLQKLRASYPGASVVSSNR